MGSYTYGPGQQAGSNPAPLHGSLSIGASYSASYDAAGNMACRAATSGTTCSGSNPSGAQLSYDNEGRLTAWQNAPGGSPTTSDGFLYDGTGNRLAQQITQNGVTTTTVYIGNFEEVSTTGGSSPSTTTTTYYYAGPLRIAEAVNGTVSYLGEDLLGSASVALSSGGLPQGAQLAAPTAPRAIAMGVCRVALGGCTGPAAVEYLYSVLSTSNTQSWTSEQTISTSSLPDNAGVPPAGNIFEYALVG